MSSQTFMPSTETVFQRTGENTMIVNMGPQHPSTHGVLRVICELEGETIVKCKCVIGYLHTGMEKEAEYQQYHKCVVMTDRMDYLNANGNNLAHALAVEKLLGCEIPKRGQYLRVILAELSRIASHLVWLGTHGLDLGAMTPYFYVMQQRELILDMFEMFSGVRMMPSWIVPGGLRGDMPAGFEARLRSFLDGFLPELQVVEDLLVENPIWKERTIDVGILSAADALNLGASGPIARASGVPFDLRKSNPYSSYEDFEFGIPTGTRGDVYDRFLVRISEMRESCKILRQAIDGLPEGAWSTSDRKIAPPPRKELDTSMESLIHHFKLFTEGFHPPVGEAYAAVEGSKGELGFYIVSDGSNRPYRWHERPSSFMNLKCLEVLAVGRLIADVVAVIGSIDIVLGEIDR
ncbi:NADH dehydrogenase (quinone) subunit D [Fimbriimonas ginsengisoli]|uniref:NADH-quinone oxidoreductase subunit D n=1 Tax=Fimbriimonas ginsengisoli Gsoil 348 TaxID=661478 RepID=A0A068NTB1_FIMGI|nr:NADH dehydrogenase (quinone) subunit D [Fimbriimonas ginsengisoli]AIE86793.1 NADH dehydrogenase I, D subunit [Fimbriimonas ginsengisoli Gsoil 348]